MKKLSGLVLDFYDDAPGEVLRSVFPKLSDVPDLVKSAYFLSTEDRKLLPDDAFALVLQDRDVTLRKYACIDPGNTFLSLLYLNKVAHRLPSSALEKAAENLQEACRWYWSTPDEFVKSAGIGGTAMNLLGGLAKGAIKNPMGAVGKAMTGMSIYGAGKQIAGNLRNVGAREAAQGGFGQIVT
jgi:hypothetical protein